MRHPTVSDATFYTNYFIDVAGHGGACAVTANQHRHDLSAAFTRTNLRLPRFKEGARLKHFVNTHRFRGKNRAVDDRNGLEEMLPLHGGDAKHPAGFAA